MSYILDALKKSEQERSKQQAPGLNTVQLEQPPVRHSKSLWIWFIPLLLGLNIVLLLWPGEQFSKQVNGTPVESSPLISGLALEPELQTALLESQQSVETAPESGQVIHSSSTLSPSTHATSTLSLSKQAPSKEADSQTAESINYHRDPFAPLQPPNPKTVPVDTSALATNAKPATKANRPSRTLPTPDLALLNQSLINQALIEKLAPLQEEQPLPSPTLSIQPATEPIALISEPPLSAKQSPARQSSAEQAIEEQSLSKQSLSKQAEQIPQFLELGDKQRKEIPPLNISVHIYTEKATDRMARINGKMVREGHSFSEQLRLVEITPHALIFNHKGEYFQIKR